MKQLKRQVSGIRFDSNESQEQNNDEVFINNDTKNGNEDLDLPPPSPFLDKNGQPINRKSKLKWRQKSNKKK